MLWTLAKQFTFEASHILPRHPGKCARLHGHSYTLTVECRGTTLQATGPETNMVCDYAMLTKAVLPLLHEHLDHYHLNDSLALAHPTAEAIAQWIYQALRPVLPGLSAVTLAETAQTWCRYSEEGMEL